MQRAYVVVARLLQDTLIADLAVSKGVLTHIVQGITIRKLRRTHCLELCGIGMQFQLCTYDLFHTSQSITPSHSCQKFLLCEENKGRFLPMSRRQGTPRRGIVSNVEAGNAHSPC